MRIAVTGSTGLIGTALVGQLKAEGHTVQRLVRRKPNSSEEVQWDPAGVARSWMRERQRESGGTTLEP